jgi:hypothetical protein
MSVQRPGKLSGTPQRKAIKSTGTLIGCRRKARRNVWLNAGDATALIKLPPLVWKSYSCAGIMRESKRTYKKSME